MNIISQDKEVQEMKEKFTLEFFSSQDLSKEEKDADFALYLSSIEVKNIYSPEKEIEIFPFGFPPATFKCNLSTNKLFVYETHKDTFKEISFSHFSELFEEGKNYLWIFNTKEEFVFAKEDQAPLSNKKRKIVKHADLICRSSNIREPAKYGGELMFRKSEKTGKVCCFLNNKSSYSTQKGKKPKKMGEWAKCIGFCLSKIFANDLMFFLCESIYIQTKKETQERCPKAKLFDLFDRWMKLEELNKEILNNTVSSETISKKVFKNGKSEIGNKMIDSENLESKNNTNV